MTLFSGLYLKGCSEQDNLGISGIIGAILGILYFSGRSELFGRVWSLKRAFLVLAIGALLTFIVKWIELESKWWSIVTGSIM